MPESASFDTWTVIFLLAAIHGIAVAMLLFKYDKGVKVANKTLAGLLLVFAVSMVYYVCFWTGYANKYPWLNFWTASLPFLFGPLMYKYVLQLDDQKPKINFRMHLLPFIIFTVYYFPFILREILNRPNWLRELYFKPLLPIFQTVNLGYIILHCLSMFIYGIIILVYVNNSRLKLNKYAIPGEIKKVRWLTQIAVFFMIFVFAYLSYWILVFTNLLSVEYDYGISVIMTFFIYWVGYKGFHQPEIIQEYVFAETGIKQEDSISSPIIPFNIIAQNQVEPKRKYRNSTLSEEDALKCHSALINLMQEQQLWKDDNLKMQQVAESLGVSTHHLSQVINGISGQTWSDFINGYRIFHAKTLLGDNNYNGKILAIAFDCGFSNKSTFNAAFKKVTGCSPSAFREQAIKKKTG